jgi:flagellar motor switch protein FliG
MMKQRDGSLRKAAVLVDSLDPNSADALLEQMGSELAGRVRRAVMDLGEIGEEERERVIAEFLRIRPPPPAVLPPAGETSGIELDGALALQLAAARSVKPAVGPARPHPDPPPPFRFLHEAASDTLTELLEREHPQTIALVAAHLPPRRAIDVLTRLPAALQADVMRRVANLDETDPEILREVEQEMELILSGRLQAAGERSAGLAALNAILGAADSEDRQAILENLGRTDQHLASLLAEPTRHSEATPAELRRPPADGAAVAPSRRGRLGPAAELERARRHVSRAPSPPAATEAAAEPPAEAFTFGDLSRLDDASLAEVLRSADPQMLFLALTGAGRETMARIESRLSPREAKRLRRRIEQLGPLRLSDVEDAQAELAALVRRLAARGAVRLPPQRRLAFAA